MVFGGVLFFWRCGGLMISARVIDRQSKFRISAWGLLTVGPVGRQIALLILYKYSKVTTTPDLGGL